MQIPRLVGSGPQGLNHLQQCSLSGAIDSLVARQLAAPALLSFADARSSVSDFFSSLGEGFADRASHNVAYYARMYLRLLAVKFVPFAARFNGLARMRNLLLAVCMRRRVIRLHAYLSCSSMR